MSLFRRTEITIRCACRGTTLAAPDRDSLLDACEEGRPRRRLQHCLATQPVDAPSWSVQWVKSAGDMLGPHDVVAVLRRNEVVVELVSTHKGILAEMLVAQGARVAAGTRLARLERRAKATAASEAPASGILHQFVARQRRDAVLITSLQTALVGHEQIIVRLRSEIAALREQQASGERVAADPKFKRLKKRIQQILSPGCTIVRRRRAAAPRARIMLKRSLMRIF